MQILPFDAQDLDGIEQVIRRLHPTWFEERALSNILADVAIQQCLVAKEGRVLVGFISFVFDKQTQEAELTWMGVDFDRRREGIGTALVNETVRRLKLERIKQISVETVGWASPRYEPYEQTVSFYEKNGFETIEKYPIRTDNGYDWRMYRFIKRIT